LIRVRTLDLHPDICLNTTVVLRRRPAGRGDVWQLRVNSNVIQYLPDVGIDGRITTFVQMQYATLSADLITLRVLFCTVGASGVEIKRHLLQRLIPFLNHPCRCCFALSSPCVSTACGFAPRHKWFGNGMSAQALQRT
jgi:hypothetical protein